MEKRTFTFEEIELELSLGFTVVTESNPRPGNLQMLREWTFTVYPTRQRDEATVYAQRSTQVCLRVFKAPFIAEYLEGALQHSPVTGTRARELVARLDQAGTPAPWDC